MFMELMGLAATAVEMLAHRDDCRVLEVLQQIAVRHALLDTIYDDEEGDDVGPLDAARNDEMPLSRVPTKQNPGGDSSPLEGLSGPVSAPTNVHDPLMAVPYGPEATAPTRLVGELPDHW
jgi:hypothetical protein